jgi:hypothetical protein
LAPAVETMLWYYAKGTPTDRQEVGEPGQFSRMSDEELAARIKEAAAKPTAANDGSVPPLLVQRRAGWAGWLPAPFAVIRRSPANALVACRWN